MSGQSNPLPASIPEHAPTQSQLNTNSTMASSSKRGVRSFISRATSSLSRKASNMSDTSDDDDEKTGSSNTKEEERDYEAPNPKEMLHKALYDAARMAFGVYAVEAWSYNDSTSKLESIGGGLQVYLPPQNADDEAKTALDRILDTSREDYIEPVDKSPGVGLAGVLWSESTSSAHFKMKSKAHADDDAERHNVVWRQVDALANDPDQPYEERLHLLAQAGFLLAAGIPYNIRGHKGLVVYYANPYANPKKLQHPTNEIYMCYAAELIGATAAISRPLENVTAMRTQFREETWRRIKIKIITVIRFGGSLGMKQKDQTLQADDMGESIQWKKGSYRESVADLFKNSAKFVKKEVQVQKTKAQRKFTAWAKKCQGGNVKIPPPMPTQQVLWSFLGVFTTHLILSRIAEWVKEGSEHTLVLAPLGAFTTLQYNLTAAPASQPRNAIFAQTLAMVVAIVLTYIPNLDAWLRIALAPAIVIPITARLGIIHPPAGALAIVFASGKLGWADMGIFFGALCLTIVTGVIINNMSEKRQYPTSWTMLRNVDIFIARVKNMHNQRRKKKEKEEDEVVAHELLVVDKKNVTGVALNV